MAMTSLVFCATYAAASLPSIVTRDLMIAAAPQSENRTWRSIWKEVTRGEARRLLSVLLRFGFRQGEGALRSGDFIGCVIWPNGNPIGAQPTSCRRMDPVLIRRLPAVKRCRLVAESTGSRTR